MHRLPRRASPSGRVKQDKILISRILSLSEVNALGCSSATLVSKGSPTKPDLFRLKFQDGREPIVLKTYALKNALVRMTVGRFVTSREHRLLSHLEDIEGICKVAHPPGPVSLFLKLIPGKALNRFGKDSLSPEVFQRLEVVVRRMHEADVVHLDLGHRGNILISPADAPVLLDFQSALYVKRWPSGIRGWLERIDRLTLLKWKEKRFPRILTPEEQRACRQREKMVLLWPWSHSQAKHKRKLAAERKPKR